MLDKKIIKEKLEKERDLLLEEMNDIGKLDPETGEWEAIPETINHEESDQNEMADRFEDFEERSSTIKILESRLQNVLNVLKSLNEDSFGMCKMCNKEIEQEKLEANPASTTCKEHSKN